MNKKYVLHQNQNDTKTTYILHIITSNKKTTNIQNYRALDSLF